MRQAYVGFVDNVRYMFSMLSPTNIKRKMREMQQMTPLEMIFGFFKMLFYIFYYSGGSFGSVIKYICSGLVNIMRGPPPEKIKEEKPPDDVIAPLKVDIQV